MSPFITDCNNYVSTIKETFPVPYQAQYQLEVTGSVSTPAAAMIPPARGVTEGVSSRCMTVSQKTMALNAMKTPPMRRSAHTNRS